MRKIKIPSKLRALLSRVDCVVSVGIALACIGTLIVSSVQFKNSLTDINSDIGVLDTLPYNPSYATEESAQTHNDEEIKTAWKKKIIDEKYPSLTIAQMSFKAGMQPYDPGILADLIVVGTYTGHNTYRYRSLVSDVKIDRILVSLADTSRLAIRKGMKETGTYKIPSFDLRAGNVIKIYTELTLRATRDGNKEITTCPVVSPPYTKSRYLPPLRPDGQYLFCLSYAPKSNATSADNARFRIVPSLYGRIPLADGKTFEPNIFCANLPTRKITKDNAEKPFGINSPDVPDEDFDRQWQEAYDKIPNFTYHDATKIDLFVDSPRTEQLYRDTAAKILRKYVN